MKKIMPTTWFFAAIIIMVFIHFIFPSGNLIVFPFRLLGLIPLAAGIVLNLKADKSLKIHATTVKPFQESAALVTDGAYRYFRNPMYMGMVLILTGIALLFGSRYIWAVVVGLAVLFEVAYIRPEEKMLESTFGERFGEYRKKSRKWL